MKVIYLAAYKAEHSKFNVTYQDINGKRDLPGDMLQIDLAPYDVVIATPPCNYWSKARGNRTKSQYAIDTKHLLPTILLRLSLYDKPFIVENVRSSIKFKENGLFDLPGVHVYFVGRHTYWTNIMFNPSSVKQKFDFAANGKRLVKNSQGGQNVHSVIDYWLEVVQDMYYNKDKEEF